MKKLILLVIILSNLNNIISSERTSLIQVDTGDSSEIVIQKAVQVVPSKRQFQWQKFEFTAFIHFGPNTFNRVEWGSGKESPADFNPSSLDTDQWISIIKKAGMKMAMLTVKHHDGYCLWQTHTTEHSVKNSPWKNGNGDVLKELVLSAQNENIKIGIYLSPADLHEIERQNGFYGNNSIPKEVKIPSNKELQKTAKKIFSYELDDYNILFMNQLYEILTLYGPIYEIWFDGANPKPGTNQKYNYSAWYDLIRNIQPEAVIAIKGPDVRWCGNEAGHTRENEWSVIPLNNHPDSNSWKDATLDDLGSRDQLLNANYLYWYPAETNTSIREGWFYRDEKQYVKTVEELLDTWYRSVGGNTVFLLNITPDRRGLIPETDSIRLVQLGSEIKKTFSVNLMENCHVTSNSFLSQNKPENIIQDDLQCWKTPNGIENAELIIQFPKVSSFNRILLKEHISLYGQRIEKFDIYRENGNDWDLISSGTTIGYKKILRFPTVSSDKIKIHITNSRIAPTLSFVGAYKADEILSNPHIYRNKDGYVYIECKTPDPKIFYSIDNSNPSTKTLEYNKPFIFIGPGTIKAVAFINNNSQSSEVITKNFEKSTTKWRVIKTTSSHPGFEGEKAIDGIEETIWHTNWDSNEINHPYSITVDLGEMMTIYGFYYTPRNDKNLTGICNEFTFEISCDNQIWHEAAQGSFPNIKNNPINQKIYFDSPIDVKYFRFTSKSAIQNSPYLSVAEIGVLTIPRAK